MKKVLIVTYYFPPCPTPGAQRIKSWFEQLPENGIKTTIITRHWNENIQNNIDFISPSIKQEKVEYPINGNRVIKLPFSPNLRDKLIIKHGLKRHVFLRKSLSYLNEKFKIFNSFKSFYTAIETELKKSNYDFIIVSGEPFELFKIASKLSDKYKTPWIADYRDAWSTNHSQNNLKHKKAELKTLQNVHSFITVSKEYSKRIQKLIKKQSIIIENGFDKIVPTKIKENKKEEFNIYYSGTIYDSPYVDIFINSIENILLNSNFKIIFHFIGIEFYQNNGVKKILETTILYSKNIKIYPRMEYSKLINELSEADALLGFIHGSQKDGIISSKHYDYLSLKKKIIYLETKFLQNKKYPHNFNWIKYAYNEQEFTNLILKAFNTRFDTIDSEINEKKLLIYSRQNQSKKLANYLNEL